ncbi:MAG: STAS domain-containing protein [Sulfuricaulis sp.]|nr:STAS domain-containing protein [Sulfuricaulis sp.]
MVNSMDPVHIEQTANTTHVALEATLGIQDAHVLHEKLGTVLTAAKTVVMDGSRVERLDAAVMQVLASFARSARERGLALSWRSPSPVLQQAVRVLGFESILGMTS